MTHTAPGIHKLREFVAQQDVQTQCHCCSETHVIPDDDDEVSLRPPDPIQPQTQDVEKLQFSLFLISCSQGILSSSYSPGMFPKDSLFTCIFHSL